MNLSKELFEKAQAAKSAEELLQMAKAKNIELSAEEAAKAFAELHKTGEISDDELDNVAGGCDDYQSGDTAKFVVGQRVLYVETLYVLHEGYEYFRYYGNVLEILPKQDGVFQIKVQFDDGCISTHSENELRYC